ncbi:ROK family transcriptional regulator [Planomonospora sp. ID82291]|uniref:ROK family transcriptional regulator n=1 Tax=Planomonospora sp. ID82291 TaxID=2738136 RepID=UPI0018C42781|nr:ROK family transcriptional regulator [Planomonospora sp. ID82291]MBG0815912.1 ROK family transcriptional regulator [Planomonospora sp. ID82291]
MPRPPGTPRLLRQLNDRAALELLLSGGPLTRAELGERTGLSKVTAGQLLSRLQERELVSVVGEQAGGRGPNAALYGVVPSCAYVAGLDVLPDRISAGIADITGELVAEVTVDIPAGVSADRSGAPGGEQDPVRLVRGAVRRACAAAGVARSRLRAFVIGTRGVVDPRSGDVSFSLDLPSWHGGVLTELRRGLGIPVAIENDVNLAALAEREYGAAFGADDFVLVWAGVGQGLGVMLGGRLHRGFTGGAGEIGWLPVPGEPLPTDVSEPQSGSFQRLVGGDAITGLAGAYGLDDGLGGGGDGDGSVGGYVRTAVAEGAEGFLDELAGRLAVGVAAVAVVLDPGLIVLGGDVGRAGGPALASRVEEAVARVCPTRPSVAVTEVEGNPVLRGALVSALHQAREEVFSGTV